ncbi:MAG: hypothetical protein OXE78_11035 [Gammaproteobacteria bacterium]|nr:hypothetical protein [Gammaproteobacteria bacterium]MCY4357016.1 hypothetical protein [Gammaproteobacteria bacterium]
MSNPDSPLDIDHIAEAGRKAKGKRPQFFNLEESERLMAILMAVVGELAVTRQRLDTLERLLEKNGTLNREAIESFHPDTTEARQRGLMQQEYISRVLRILQQEKESLEQTTKSGPEKSLEQVSSDLGKS